MSKSVFDVQGCRTLTLALARLSCVVCVDCSYMIKAVHGDCEWILCRRFKHLRSVHESLWVMRQKAKIPVPTRGYHTLVSSLSCSILKFDYTREIPFNFICV